MKPRDRDQGEQRYAVTLVGSFDDPATLLRALQAFSAAAFSPQELICLPGSGPPPVGSVSAKLSNFLKRVLGSLSCGEELGTMHAPLAFREGVLEVLEAGGGLVFVLPPSRFQQACQLIHQAGGHVGLRRL